MSANEKKLDPTPGKLIFALRAIGYTFQQAIADLVDNSINAKARGVAIRAVMGAKDVIRVAIIDDGRGMTEAELDESMRLGSDVHRDVASLGKYGMGLKLASLSQAQRMTVITRSKTHCGGRRWTIDGISRGWQCEVIEEDEVLAELDNPDDSLDLTKSGTIVIWEELDKIKASKSGLDGTVTLLFHHLKQHLGLHFHRFLEDGRLEITLEKQDAKRPKEYRFEKVTALNPFEYDESGSTDFPMNFPLALGEGKELNLEAHVWPANATTANYKLGGKAAIRQGFYFYRNDRLIQAGGWNDTRGDAEPHMSLARVRIDLPKRLDELFGLNVQKSSIQVPPEFGVALKAAEAPDQTKWTEYLRVADKVYRSGQRRNAENHPVVPDAGLNKGLRVDLRGLLASGTGKVRRVSFEWSPLHHGKIFELDWEHQCIRLNSHYRKKLLQGAPATSGDAPVLKVLLFMLNREVLFSKRYSAQQKEQVELLNNMLYAVVETLRSE